MVCVPCIFLPILLAIYLKFIQPLILRFLPERWIHILDPILYPTCPINVPKKEETSETVKDEEVTTSDSAKKDL